MPTSPTQRSLQYARKSGYVAGVVERWAPLSIKQPDGTFKMIPYGKRHDLFGCIDIVCLDDLHTGIIGIQATSRTNHNARLAKSKGCEELAVWLRCGGKFEVWSWAKQGAAGKRKLWNCKRQEITLTDMEATS